MSDEKPSREFRWLLSEGATHSDIQAYFDQRIEKIKTDYKQLVRDLIREYGREAGIAQARVWLAEDAELGLPPQFVSAATHYLDELADA